MINLRKNHIEVKMYCQKINTKLFHESQNCEECKCSGWEWRYRFRNFLDIHDPDGWDRNNMYCMDEVITLGEFVKRAALSTTITQQEKMPPLYAKLLNKFLGRDDYLYERMLKNAKYYGLKVEGVDDLRTLSSEQLASALSLHLQRNSRGGKMKFGSQRV